jgi:DNA-binding GntR family transcriptional regulator
LLQQKIKCETFLQAIKPLEPRASLGEAAYLHLKESIMQGEFPANRKMTLRAVATALGVNTTPARDAINRLLAEMEWLQTLIDKGLDRRRYDQVLKANREFHFTVYKRSGWPRLVSMIESLWLRAGPSLLDLYPEFREHRKGVSNHLALMKTLKQKDAAKARAAMEQDLKDGYERLKCAIEERERRIHGEEPLAQY